MVTGEPDCPITSSRENWRCLPRPEIGRQLALYTK
jgi:hypothetical protein